MGSALISATGRGGASNAAVRDLLRVRDTVGVTIRNAAGVLAAAVRVLMHVLLALAVHVRVPLASTHEDGPMCGINMRLSMLLLLLEVWWLRPMLTSVRRGYCSSATRAG